MPTVCRTQRTSRSSNFLSRAAALRFLSDRALRRARLCASRTTALHPPRLYPSSGLDITNMSNSLSIPAENGLDNALTPFGAGSVACAAGTAVAVSRAIVAATVPPTDPNGARTDAMLFGGGGEAGTSSPCSEKRTGEGRVHVTETKRRCICISTQMLTSRTGFTRTPPYMSL